jgi:hypothetical protein
MRVSCTIRAHPGTDKPGHNWPAALRGQASQLAVAGPIRRPDRPLWKRAMPPRPDAPSCRRRERWTRPWPRSRPFSIRSWAGPRGATGIREGDDGRPDLRWCTSPCDIPRARSVHVVALTRGRALRNQGRSPETGGHASPGADWLDVPGEGNSTRRSRPSVQPGYWGTVIRPGVTCLALHRSWPAEHASDHRWDAAEAFPRSAKRPVTGSCSAKQPTPPT